MAFDTTRLTEQITIKGCLPTGRFTPADLLDMAYDVMLSEIVPEVIDVREEYYVRRGNLDVSGGEASYPINTRALGGVLRELKYISGTDVIDLIRTDIEEIISEVSGTPEKFYIEGNNVILWPTPSATVGVLRQFFFIRPSKFVLPEACAQITAIDTLTKTVTATTPSGWSTANTFDFVKGRAHYDIIDIDHAASSVSGTEITFVSDLPAGLRVGDFVCLAEESCFPFLPIEGHMALSLATAAAALESTGDPKAAEVASKAAMLKKNFRTVMSVRVQGAPKRLAARVL